MKFFMMKSDKCLVMMMTKPDKIYNTLILPLSETKMGLLLGMTRIHDWDKKDGVKNSVLSNRPTDNCFGVFFIKGIEKSSRPVQFHKICQYLCWYNFFYTIWMKLAPIGIFSSNWYNWIPCNIAMVGYHFRVSNFKN